MRLAEGSEGGGQPVLARMQAWSAGRCERQREREQALEEEEAALFTPSISEATQLLLTARPGRLSETEEERTVRLARTDPLVREEWRAAAEAASLARHPFAPRIDGISARIGGRGCPPPLPGADPPSCSLGASLQARIARPKSDDELMRDRRGKARRASAVEAWRRAEEEGRTFAPRLSAASEAIAARVTDTSSTCPRHVHDVSTTCPRRVHRRSPRA